MRKIEGRAAVVDADAHMRDEVRRAYATTALTMAGTAAVDGVGTCATDEGAPRSGAGCCAGPADGAPDAGSAGRTGFGPGLYDATDLAGIPVAVVGTSLGCGTPTTTVELRTGDRVLDLGCGGGTDVLLAARQVGPTGVVHGLDMTVEMLELARANVDRAGATNVELHLGTIEAVPLPDGAVDVVISNCVVNLSTSPADVVGEMFRVLSPGGRVNVSDVVADDRLSPAERAERGSYVGCVAGALSEDEWLRSMRDAGFVDVEVGRTHEVADGMYAATVRAVRPLG